MCVQARTAGLLPPQKAESEHVHSDSPSKLLTVEIMPVAAATKP